MADAVKKGARISGADRAKLVGDLTKENVVGDSVTPLNGEVPEESAPGPEDVGHEDAQSGG